MTNEPDEWAVAWRTEDGAEGPVLVPTIRGIDVACVADNRHGQKVVTFGANYQHETTFADETYARGYIESNAQLLYGLKTVGS